MPEPGLCEQCGKPIPPGQADCPECKMRGTSAGSFPREVLIAAVAIVLLPSFFVAARVTRAFHAEGRDLAEAWFERGEGDLKLNRPDAAIDAYLTALHYSPSNPSFELRLAEALISGNRTVEARSYLVAMWEREPESGPVNYALARLAAVEGNVTDAIRYYHGAIYSEWESPDENRRRNLRLAGYRYLRMRGAQEQAEAELMAPPERRLATRCA